MSTAQPTPDDIWKLLHEITLKFQETDRQFKETNLMFKETDLKFQENERLLKELLISQQETDRRFKETDLKFKETNLKFQENEQLLKELLISQQETDRRFKETDRRFRETDKIIGNLGNRLGDFIEETVRPAAVRLFRDRNIDVHEVLQNVKVQRGNDGIEIDLLVANDNDAVAIECKSNLSKEDVQEHLARLAKFKKMLPKYANSRIRGAVAAMVIPDAVAKYAYRQGLFIIAQSGEQMVIRNDQNFTPKIW